MLSMQMVTMFRVVVLGIALVVATHATAETEKIPVGVQKTLKSLGMENAPIEWIDDIGLFEVITSRGALYISQSGRQFVFGELYSVDSGEPVNQTAARKATRANQLIGSSFPEKDMVRFAAKGDVKETLYVFTDPNCGYCRKLHQEVSTLNSAGVNVYYIPFPVIREESRQDSVNIWCAKDRNAAMTRAKNGSSNPTAQCDSPIETGLALGGRLGVNGTPYMVAKQTNMVFAGFVPTEKLLQQLGIR